MNLRDLDLNLLRVLDALLRERSATGAAKRLNVSQPTVSFSLNKLRAVLDDQLFVKTPHGMEPTPRALSLAAPLDRIFETISRDILAGSAFDPRTAERQFVLMTGEIGELTIVPALVDRLQKEAPGVNIKAIGFPPSDREVLLEEGKADLAIGYLPEIERPVFYQQTLLSSPFVCVLRRNHPAVSDGRLTLESFCEMDHAIFGTQSLLETVYEPEFKRRGIQRRIALELAHLASAPTILSTTDLVSLVPEALGRIYCRDRRLQMVPPPLELTPHEVKQIWHRRVHQDAGHLWLRKLVATTLSDMKSGGIVPRRPKPVTIKTARPRRRAVAS
jgi:DNA-binding transcriptional LysR family regulator